MAYLDETALGELWARIGEIFARRIDALGSIVLSGTSLVARYVSGDTASTIDLNDTFATDAEAAAASSLALSGTSLTLKDCDGTTKSSIDLGDTFATDTEAAKASGLTADGTSLKLADCDGTNKSTVNLASVLDSRYGGGLSISGTTLKLKAKNSAELDSVTIPTTDTTPIYDYVKDHYAASVAVGLTADGKLTVALYNGLGEQISSDYVYLPTTT